ncbi:MAG: hypothetical protein WAU77_10670 [Solirubrobacteraceae bacterium]
MARTRDTGDGPVRGLRCLAPLPVQFQRVGLVLLTAVALGALAFAGVTYWVFESPGGCSAHVYVCGVTGGVGGIAVAALIGAAGFVWVSRHVLRRYWRVAKAKPWSLVASAAYQPKPGAATTNARLIAETIVPSPTAGLRRSPSWARFRAWFEPVPSVPPQLVVGQAGEGKTTLLVELTRLLAEKHRVPVPVSLREVGSFDGFLALAKKAFESNINEQLASSDEADRIWRWVCWTGRLVVLADDLQLLDADRARLADAFREAEREKYALVVTSRRDRVGPALEAWRVPVSQLDADEALEEVGGKPEEPTPLNLKLRKLIEHGELNESRYYIAVLTRLIEHRGITKHTRLPHLTRLAVRRWLLDRYADAYKRGTLTPGDAVKPADRAQALAEMAHSCFVAVADGEEATIEVSSPGLESAVAAQFLRRSVGDDARVEHALLQSYLASRELAMGPEEQWRALARSNAETPEARDALLFYAGRPDRSRTARDLVLAMLECDADESDKVSIALAATDIVFAADVTGLEARLVRRLRDASENAGTLERRRLVERLARIPGDGAISALWKICDDSNYRVSWEAGCALAGAPTPPGVPQHQRAVQATQVLEKTIHNAIANGEKLAARLTVRATSTGERQTVDDWDPAVRPLKRLGWILPVLAVGADDISVFAHLDRLLPLCGIGATGDVKPLTEQRGPEASIAQGFKAAARLATWDLREVDEPPTPATIDELLERMTTLYGDAQFWYSRLVLLHGLTDLVIRSTREAAGGSADVQKARTIITDAKEAAPCGAVPDGWTPADPQPADTREHAFVVETATLCSAAIEEVVRAFGEGADEAALRAIREKYIWDDEGVAVGTPPKRLTPRTLRLLGDVAVLLNLNEAGARTFTDEDVARDRELREQFAINNYLPWCLSLGHNRDVLLDPQGQCGCPFERCPYPRNVQRAHRELSKLFCRDARSHALAFSRPLWQSKLRGTSYWRFWMEMERKAKYGA